MSKDLSKLRQCVQRITELVEIEGLGEPELLMGVRQELASLIKQDDWLPDEFARPGAEHYLQYLLYCDPRERFSIISSVWGAGQKTPVHDHLIWGLIGVLRGSETCIAYASDAAGKPLSVVGEFSVSAGEIDEVSSRAGDIHEVANTFDDRVSISIHIYGGNIGKIMRHVYNVRDGTQSSFRSHYANAVLPNIWSWNSFQD